MSLARPRTRHCCPPGRHRHHRSATPACHVRSVLPWLHLSQHARSCGHRGHRQNRRLEVLHGDQLVVLDHRLAHARVSWTFCRAPFAWSLSAARLARRYPFDAATPFVWRRAILCWALASSAAHRLRCPRNGRSEAGSVVVAVVDTPQSMPMAHRLHERPRPRGEPQTTQTSSRRCPGRRGRSQPMAVRGTTRPGYSPQRQTQTQTPATNEKPRVVYSNDPRVLRAFNGAPALDLERVVQRLRVVQQHLLLGNLRPCT